MLLFCIGKPSINFLPWKDNGHGETNEKGADVGSKCAITKRKSSKKETKVKLDIAGRIVLFSFLFFSFYLFFCLNSFLLSVFVSYLTIF